MLRVMPCFLAAALISAHVSSLTRTLCTHAISRCFSPSNLMCSIAAGVPFPGVVCGDPTVPKRKFSLLVVKRFSSRDSFESLAVGQYYMKHLFKWQGRET